MSIIRTSQPSVEPVSLAEMRELLSIQPGYTASDSIIDARIKDARQWAEQYMERTILTSNWRLTLDAFPDEILLPYPPVQAVLSVSYIDTHGNIQFVPSSDYVLDNASDMSAWLLPRHGTRWPETLDAANSVVVLYTAGYPSVNAVPAPIKEAIKIMVLQMMQYQSQQASGYAPDIPRAALSRLNPYRVMRF